MATHLVISLKPDQKVAFKAPNITEASTATVNQILQENHDRYHPFFSDRGLHNHISHYMYAAWSLGAEPYELQRGYVQEKALQRPLPPLTEENVAKLSDPGFFKSCMGDWNYYTDYLFFFQKEIAKKGVGAIVNEYVFSGTLNAELMFTRLFASFLHPIIHLGYRVEFDQPAQVAEGLAQIAVHKNEVAIPMSGTDEAAKASQGQPGVAMVDLLDDIHNSDVIRNAPCWRDGSYIEDDPLVEAPEELWQTAAKWRVDPYELRERTAEMINVNAYFCGGAQRPEKEVKLDFFLIHNLNCSIFFTSFLEADWLSLKNKVRLLTWKGRFDLIAYAARGSPTLYLNEIANYKPRRPEQRWSELFKRVNSADDEAHVTKIIRALAHGELVCKGLVGKRFPVQGDMWLKIAHMALDTTEREIHVLRRWVRGAGFPSQWNIFTSRVQ